MSRKRKSSPLDDLFEIAAMLPWWISVIVAVVTYLVCHSYATAEVAAAKGLSQLDPQTQQGIIKVFASFAQYVLPLIFLAGAAASAIAQAKRGGGAGGSLGATVARRPAQTKDSDRKADSDEEGTDLYPTWKTPPDENASATQADPSRWSPELLRALEWKRFEEVCAGLFEHLGFTTKTATTGADGGVDIHLFRPPAEQAVAIVQCKARTSSKVGVRVARELHGVMASMHIAEGILATSSTFSDDAREYAKANHIDLMDADRILQAIATLTGAQQASLLQLATVGDYTTPTCPSCGVKMTERRARESAKPFWGCVNYPRCRSVINIARA